LGWQAVHALPQFVWDFWRGFARAGVRRGIFLALGNRYTGIEHRFYRVGLLKTPPYGKCGLNRKMVWHIYGKTKTAITSSKNQFRPQF
jgi:hypothetical protein